MSIVTTPGVYFIPHYSVYAGSPATSKLRVVFDASATSGSKSSLNQCLYTGPKLQQDIVDILFRFRIYEYAFTADVCKMYRQILVLPEYRKFQHIFWRPSPLDKIEEFELNTVTYGTNCAPFLALRVLQDIAEQECTDLPQVRNALQRQTFVDDICVGASSTSELLQLQSDLQMVLGSAGLELKKWSSNSVQVLSAVLPENRAVTAVNFNDHDGGLVKVLGLQWQSYKNVFEFKVQLSSKAFTKRSVLSAIAQIFDPLGFIAPVVFHAKHILQLIWKTELNWDDPLPQYLAARWQAFVEDLNALTNIQISRHISVAIFRSIYWV
ncbi:uncharacterized protein LOC126898172 [Daktulosphaira vitifoliae]|uniref:uncharacterized protein LOC126898172 n=1 Tax=Daktulosphaira vitifoliae TaxID=58002 RepID=UPI0021AA5ABE|nr:uncharacterized protein LOC126898172 [Daktulosphaira vitifoliae]